MKNIFLQSVAFLHLYWIWPHVIHTYKYSHIRLPDGRIQRKKEQEKKRGNKKIITKTEINCWLTYCFGLISNILFKLLSFFKYYKWLMIIEKNLNYCIYFACKIKLHKMIQLFYFESLCLHFQRLIRANHANL